MQQVVEGHYGRARYLNLKRSSIAFTARYPAKIAFWVLSLVCTESAFCDENDASDKYAMIKFIADSVGDECTSVQIRQLGITKSQCDIRHANAVSRCSEITLDDSPGWLDSRGRLRASLVFSLCRGVVMQEASFEIDKWEPTIKMLLDQAFIGAREAY